LTHLELPIGPRANARLVALTERRLKIADDVLVDDHRDLQRAGWTSTGSTAARKLTTQMSQRLPPPGRWYEGGPDRT
jgi:hypothetical protein